jgi:hypothetical protein
VHAAKIKSFKSFLYDPVPRKGSKEVEIALELQKFL